MINQVLEDANAMLCVDCGKCVAVCPMAEMYEDFSLDISPRGIIKKALLPDYGDILEDAALWRCTGCDAGTRVCPEGVSCREMIQGLRELAMEKSRNIQVRSCARCGVMVTTLPVSDYIQKQLAGKRLDYLDLCPTCRQQVYMERNTMA